MDNSQDPDIDLLIKIFSFNNDHKICTSHTIGITKSRYVLKLVKLRSWDSTWIQFLPDNLMLICYSTLFSTKVIQGGPEKNKPKLFKVIYPKHDLFRFHIYPFV